MSSGVIGIPFTGTLGILLDAKTKWLIPEVAPILDQLNELQFRRKMSNVEF